MALGSSCAEKWLLAAALMCAFGANAADAQDWPTKQPIRVVVPTTPGSTSDVMARIVYEQVGRQLGQNVVTENRGGAGTTTGMSVVAHSAPDGYTLLVNDPSGPLATGVSLYP